MVTNLDNIPESFENVPMNHGKTSKNIDLIMSYRSKLEE
jgi:hypothetical protein